MKKLLFALIAALCLMGAAHGQSIQQQNLLSAQSTTTAACSSSRAVPVKNWATLRTFFASGTTSASTGAATVIIYASHSGDTTWVELGTITLTLATTITFGTSTGGFVSEAPWPFVCAHVSAISGTGASVTVSVGSL